MGLPQQGARLRHFLRLNRVASIGRVRAEMTDAFAALDGGLAGNRHVRILKRGGGHIAVSPLERQPEPLGLVALKAEIARRWPMTTLLDMLKEADLRIGFTDALRTVTDHENLPSAPPCKQEVIWHCARSTSGHFIPGPDFAVTGRITEQIG